MSAITLTTEERELLLAQELGQARQFVEQLTQAIARGESRAFVDAYSSLEGIADFMRGVLADDIKDENVVRWNAEAIRGDQQPHVAAAGTIGGLLDRLPPATENGEGA